MRVITWAARSRPGRTRRPRGARDMAPLSRDDWQVRAMRCPTGRVALPRSPPAAAWPIADIRHLCTPPVARCGVPVPQWAVRRTSPSRVSLLLCTEPLWAAASGIAARRRTARSARPRGLFAGAGRDGMRPRGPGLTNGERGARSTGVGRLSRRRRRRAAPRGRRPRPVRPCSWPRPAGRGRARAVRPAH